MGPIQLGMYGGAQGSPQAMQQQQMLQQRAAQQQMAQQAMAQRDAQMAQQQQHQQAAQRAQLENPQVAEQARQAQAVQLARQQQAQQQQVLQAAAQEQASPQNVPFSEQTMAQRFANPMVQAGIMGGLGMAEAAGRGQGVAQSAIRGVAPAIAGFTGAQQQNEAQREAELQRARDEELFDLQRQALRQRADLSAPPGFRRSNRRVSQGMSADGGY